MSESNVLNVDPGLNNKIKFDENGLIPVVSQHYRTGEILMLAYFNRESLEQTLATGRATYWSRSRQKLWMKGETSGHIQNVKEILLDCDEDSLILLVDQVGPACHTGERTCFYRILAKSPLAETQPCSGCCSCQT